MDQEQPQQEQSLQELSNFFKAAARTIVEDGIQDRQRIRELKEHLKLIQEKLELLSGDKKTGWINV